MNPIVKQLGAFAPDSLRAMMTLSPRGGSFWHNLTVALAVAFVALVLIRMLRHVTLRLGEARLEDAEPGEDYRALRLKEQRTRTIAGLFRSLGTVLIAAAATILMLRAFVDIRPFLALAGIAGIALSFGAQSLVKDIINGIFILVEGQYAIGDVVTIGTVSGLVERITLRATTLRDLHGIVHTIPNGTVATVSNRTKEWSRAVVDVTISYSSNVDRAIEALQAAAHTMRDEGRWRAIMVDAPEVLGIQQLGEHGIVLRLISKTIPLKQWEVERELRRRVITTFRREGIEIALPRLDLRVRESEALS